MTSDCEITLMALLRRLFGVAFIFANVSFQASAADIRPYISGAYRAIVIEGKIEPGDFDTFNRIVRENNGRVSGVFCFSPGGDFYEAMKIGRAMRAFELHSQAPMKNAAGRPVCEDGSGILDIKPNDAKNCTCASAGFFLHIGATSKGGTYLAVHRPYFEKGRFGNLPEADAKKAFDTLQASARDYMREMGVPQHIQEEVLGTPSDKILVLDDATVKTYFWGDLPYRHDWLENKCARLSNSERQRSNVYSARLRGARSAASSDLSKAERADLDALQKKEEAERNCRIAINQQGRIEAYGKYFHERPTDFGNQNFSKWSEVTKYLGRYFYELASEEKFEEDHLLDQTSLKREATATTPALLLFDAPEHPKVVASIAVLSTPYPSQEYIERLIKSLEAAWGKPSAGNGETNWRWTTAKFYAELKKDKAAEGPYVHLRIQSRE